MKELNFLSIGNRIRKQREFLGYTRDRLAELIDVTPIFCRDIEIGSKGMSIQTLFKISQALKVSTDYILNGEVFEENQEPLQLMLNSCSPDKKKYAEDILKSFLLALE